MVLNVLPKHLSKVVWIGPSSIHHIPPELPVFIQMMLTETVFELFVSETWIVTQASYYHNMKALPSICSFKIIIIIHWIYTCVCTGKAHMVYTLYVMGYIHHKQHSRILHTLNQTFHLNQKATFFSALASIFRDDWCWGQPNNDAWGFIAKDWCFFISRVFRHVLHGNSSKEVSNS